MNFKRCKRPSFSDEFFRSSKKVKKQSVALDTTKPWSLLQSNIPYIKPELEENVKNYKYRSCVGSIYYEKVQSPLCDWIV